jgi:hypothetical protein
MERVLVELRRIADVLERLAGGTLTPLNNPLLTLNSLNLNSSSDSEIKSRSEEGMQGGKQTVKRRGGNAGRTLLPKDFKFDDNTMRFGREVLGFTEQQVYQHFNAFRDYWGSEGRMKANWQLTFKVWLRREKHKANAASRVR